MKSRTTHFLVVSLIWTLSLLNLAIFQNTLPAHGSAPKEKFIYHAGPNIPVTFFKLNLRTGEDLQINVSDTSCTNLLSSSVSDLEVDSSRSVLYWVSHKYVPYSNFIAKLDLLSGQCQKIAEIDGKNTNNQDAIWRGLTLDIEKNLLFFVDNQAFTNSSDTSTVASKNNSLLYIDLARADFSNPSTTYTALPITVSSNSQTEVNFANDLVIKGDYAYINGKNETCPVNHGCADLSDPSGVAIYRVKLFNGSSIETSENRKSTKIFSWSMADAISANPSGWTVPSGMQLNSMRFYGGFLYFSEFASWQIGGVWKIPELNIESRVSPITTPTKVLDNTNYQDFIGAVEITPDGKLFTSYRTDGNSGDFRLMSVNIIDTSSGIDCGQEYHSGVYNSTFNSDKCSDNHIRTDINSPAASYGQLSYAEEDAFTVTYDKNTGEGSAPSIDTKYLNVDLVLPSMGVLTKNGYGFAGWNEKEDGTGRNYSAGSNYTGNANITLYANWKLNGTVTYNGNGNTSGSSPETQTKIYGTNLVLANKGSLLKSGYLFDGWYTNSEGIGGTKFAEGSNYSSENTITLFAKWNAITPCSPTNTNLAAETYLLSFNNTTMCNWLVPNNVNSVDYLIVGGGGGGGGDAAGGGAGGIVISGQLNVSSGENIQLFVGAGGLGGGAGHFGADGNSSVLTMEGTTFTASGGSGGGNCGYSGGVCNSNLGGSNGSLFGRGGNGTWLNSRSNYPSSGQNGISSSITGINLTYGSGGGGGGGGEHGAACTGGLGGAYSGGHGFNCDTNSEAANGLINTGGGGGGGGNQGGSGADGVIYISYVSKYQIRYNGNLNSSGNSPIDSNFYLKDGIAMILGNTGSLQKNSSTFAGWTLNDSGTGTVYQTNDTVTVTSDLTLYAKWKLVGKITASSGANGSISNSGMQNFIQGDGKIIKYEFTPNSGYRVASILKDGIALSGSTTPTFEQAKSNGITFSDVVGDHVLDVTYELIPVTPPAGGGGGGTSVTVVSKKTPVITWTPNDINEGELVTFVNPLNATLSVPGSATYSIASGFKPAAGPLEITVLFTPTDSANYYSVTTTRTIQVIAKASPTPTPSPTVTDSPSPTPSVTPSPSNTQSSNPSPSPTISKSSSPAPAPAPTPRNSSSENSAPSSNPTSTAVTLNQVKGSITVTTDPKKSAIVVTIATFPVLTSPASKLIAVATSSETGQQITANFKAKVPGSKVTLNAVEGITKYKVDLLYISTKGQLKTLQSKSVTTPVVKPVISTNSSNIKVQNAPNNSQVRVYIGKVQPITTPSPTPKATKAPITSDTTTKVRVFIGKVEK